MRYSCFAVLAFFLAIAMLVSVAPLLRLTLPITITVPMQPADAAVPRRAVIVATTINRAWEMRASLESLAQICAVFSSCVVLVYENDSWDTTVRLLRSAHVPFELEIITESNLHNLPFGRFRTVKLAHGRNTLLRAVTARAAAFDVLIVYDIDRPIPARSLPVIADAASSKWDQWPVSTSFSSEEAYYDLWALRCCVGEVCKTDNCWGSVPSTCRPELYPCLDNRTRLVTVSPTDEFLEVHSAFNGIALYKLQAIADSNCTYGDGLDHSEEQTTPYQEECEHVAFHKCLREKLGRDAVVISKGRISYNVA